MAPWTFPLFKVVCAMLWGEICDCGTLNFFIVHREMCVMLWGEYVAVTLLHCLQRAAYHAMREYFVAVAPWTECYTPSLFGPKNNLPPEKIYRICKAPKNIKHIRIGLDVFFKLLSFIKIVQSLLFHGLNDTSYHGNSFKTLTCKNCMKTFFQST